MLFLSVHLSFLLEVWEKCRKRAFRRVGSCSLYKISQFYYYYIFLFLDLIDLVKRWVRFPNVHNSNDLKNRSAMCTCGLMLSLIPFRWSLFLNVSIWELNCYKWDGSHCKGKGVEICELCNIEFFIFLAST